LIVACIPWESAETTDSERVPIVVRATDRKEAGNHAAARGSIVTAHKVSFMVQRKKMSVVITKYRE
jgi:hypothetical protein